MKRSLDLLATVCGPVAGSLLLMGFVFRSDDPFASAIVDHTYESADLGKLELEGACSISADNIQCWAPDGKPAPSVEDKVKAYYLVNSDPGLRMKFGRKNRLVVFEEPEMQRQQGASVGSAKTLGGQIMNAIGQIYGSNAGDVPRLAWYQVDVDPSEDKTSIVFDISSQFGTASLPLKVGSGATIGTTKLKITEIKPGPERKQNWGPNPTKGQKTWTVTVELDGKISGKYPDLRGSFIEANGQPLWSVNAEGIPNRRTNQPGLFVPNMNGNYDANVFLAGGAGSAKQELSVPVNPAKAPNLVLSLTGARQVTFKDILLDPK